MFDLNKFDCIIETERVIVRPLKEADYINWLREFENRIPSQHRHDKGNIDMGECTKEWFINLVKKHQELAEKIQHMCLACLGKKTEHIGEK